MQRITASIFEQFIRYTIECQVCGEEIGPFYDLHKAENAEPICLECLNKEIDEANSKLNATN